MGIYKWIAKLAKFVEETRLLDGKSELVEGVKPTDKTRGSPCPFRLSGIIMDHEITIFPIELA